MQLIHDPLIIPETVDFMNRVLSTSTVQTIQQLKHQELDQCWRAWLTASSYNRVIGLDQFCYSSFCAGTTPAFGEFISRNCNRRVRASRSDFIVSRILSRSYNRALVHLEDEELHSNDCVIMSFPFSGNGSLYPAHDRLLDQADQLGVPVFVDGAYFSISHGIDYPLYRKCVTDFVLSLSKSMGDSSFRMGIRFTRNKVDDGITAPLLGHDIFDRLNSYVSIKLLNEFSHDWIINKYRPTSDLICAQNNLTPTNTLTLALGGQEHLQFKRGDYIRVCISKELSRLSTNR
jgi:hypothetical protein